MAVTRRALSDGDRHLGTVEARSRATVQIIADGKTIAGSNGGGAVVKRSVILANGEAVTRERSAVQAVGYSCLGVVVAQRDRAIMVNFVQERTSATRQDADTLSKSQLADLGAIRNNNTRIGIVLRIGSIETVRAGEGTEGQERVLKVFEALYFMPIGWKGPGPEYVPLNRQLIMVRLLSVLL